jgi:hypothetical protein
MGGVEVEVKEDGIGTVKSTNIDAKRLQGCQEGIRSNLWSVRR